MLKNKPWGRAELQDTEKADSCRCARAYKEEMSPGEGVEADGALSANQSSALQEHGEEPGHVPWKQFLRGPNYLARGWR